jgi:deoxyribonuclease-4
MENSAGTGDTIGRSLDELEVLFERLEGHPRLGMCLDSCHLFASGYDVGDPDVVDALVSELDERIGLERVRALHVNDSATPLGSNRDRHANVLDGEIGERLGAFLAHPRFQHLSTYLEVPAVDEPDTAAAEIEKLRELHARWV